MIKLKNFLHGAHNENEYDLENEENDPKGWPYNDVEFLYNMGFDRTGNSRMQLKLEIRNRETSICEVYKNELGYILEINGRKHVFKDFKQMMRQIDEFGKVKI